MKPHHRFVKDFFASAAVIGAIAIGMNIADAATILPQSQPASAAAVSATSSLSSNRIDTNNREAVRQRFLNDYVANDRHISPNNGADVNKCEAGLVNPAAAKSIETVLNFFRGMTGADALQIDTTGAAAKYTQYAALNMAANRRLDHRIVSSSKCFSEVAATGAGSSNLSSSQGQTPAEQILWYYMDWSGSGASTLTKDSTNDRIGHRTLLMDPTLAMTGYGNVNGYNAIMGNTRTAEADADIEDIKNAGGTMPETMAWPSAGYFPSQLLTNHAANDKQDVERWNFGVKNAKADFSAAQVQVTDPNGKALPVRIVRTHTEVTGYKSVVFKLPAITNAPQNTDAVHNYRVTVSNVKGAAQSSYTYTVKLFDPMVTTSPQKPNLKVLQAPRAIQGAEAVPARIQVTGSANIKYQWQRSTDNGNTWEDINDKYDERFLSANRGLPTSLNYAPAKGTCVKNTILKGCAFDSEQDANKYSFRLRATNAQGTTYSETLKVKYFGFSNTQIERKGDTLHAELRFAGDGDSIWNSGVITWVDAQGNVYGTGQDLKVTDSVKGKKIYAYTDAALGTFAQVLTYTMKLPPVQL